MGVGPIAKVLRGLRDIALGAFNDQAQLIRSRLWNYIIILDACRFDYFERAWLKPVKSAWSPGSNTQEWVRRTWPGYYPYKVYSTNPFINSKGLGHFSYTARDHFKEIIDLWLTEWDDDVGTVRPEAVVEATRDAPPMSIIWFLQPHAPYLEWDESLGHPDGMDFLNWTPDRIDELYPQDPATHRAHYWVNVHMVVDQVRELLKSLEPPILITSDHGELLGEGGRRGHPGKSRMKELRLVPVVVIE